MPKRRLFIILFISLLQFGGAPPRNDLLQRELTTLNERGGTYRMLSGNQLKVTDARSGQQWMFDAERLLTPRKGIYDTIPTLTVDLTTIDTNVYNWRFHYVNSLPISGEWGFPLQVGDLNHNGRPEAYGVYQTQATYVARGYEQGALGEWLFRFQYQDVGRVDMQADVDRNSLFEVYLRYGDSLFVYEQAIPDSLPRSVKFRHRQWYQSVTGIPNQVSDMNGDGKPEILYRGSRPDTVSPPNIEKTFIMTYDSLTNNLREVSSFQLPPDCFEEHCTGAIATGDFDGDGKKEFVTSNFAGNAYVVEHVAGDSFAVAWSTNLSVAGRAAAGDVDGNGITEFFIGGTQVESDGYVHLRAYAFERTGNNTYQPTFAFNIFPAGIFFVDLYQTADVDGDGVPEFLLSFAGGIAIFKGAGEHNYELFYHKFVGSLDGLAAWKINGNRAAHLFVSRSIGSQQIISQTDVYQLDSSIVTGIVQGNELPTEVRLFQNYPNPFNPSTIISYNLPVGAHVTLKVYDVLGREVATLVDGFVQAGHHEATLSAPELSSGIYFYRMQAGGFTSVKKLVLLK